MGRIVDFDTYYDNKIAPELALISRDIQQKEHTNDKGGFVDPTKFADYMFNHAKFTPVEVLAYGLEKDGIRSYFVLPWINNTATENKFYDINYYLPGYTIKNITGLFHTHLLYGKFSSDDRWWSDNHLLPVYMVYPNGDAYYYLNNLEGDKDQLPEKTDLYEVTNY